MPRPRFHNLDEQRREQILAAAAEAFAQGGLGASLNQIIGHAKISKGAFYYYFDDKFDLYTTVLKEAWKHCEAQLNRQPSPETLSTENFWAAFEAQYHDLLDFAASHPTLLGVLKTFVDIPKENSEHPEVKNLLERFRAWIERFLRRGQTLGVIRDDLPLSLLTRLAMSIDITMEQAFLESWDGSNDSASDAIRLIIDMLHRVLAAKVHFPTP